MKVSEQGVKFIQTNEGTGTIKDGVFYAYWDKFGAVWTIGHGLTHDKNGEPVKQGMQWSVNEEREQFTAIVEKECEPVVNQLMSEYKCILTQNQFDALCDFVYNVGATAFKASKLRRLIGTKADPELILKEFDKWIYAKGRKNQGLINRRNKEKALYIK